MSSDPGRIVTCAGRCAMNAVSTRHAHHRDFPELWAEGRDVNEAAAHLERHLARALEQSPTPWQRAELERAMGDVAAYRKQLARTPPEAGTFAVGAPPRRASEAVAHGLAGRGRP